MKQEYYPSLELNRKLSEIWIPHNWKIWMTKDWMLYNNYQKKDIDNTCEWIEWNPVYSVMEMLDVINLKKFKYDYRSYHIKIIYLNNNWYSEIYMNSDTHWMLDWKKFNWTLSNALAEMIIWLVEQKYLSFNQN